MRLLAQLLSLNTCCGRHGILHTMRMHDYKVESGARPQGCAMSGATSSGVGDRLHTSSGAVVKRQTVSASRKLSFRVPFRFRVNYVSENTSAHNAHQPPTDNTRTDADFLRVSCVSTGRRHNTGRSPGTNA
jgi:hypothetical protein